MQTCSSRADAAKWGFSFTALNWFSKIKLLKKDSNDTIDALD